MVQYRYIFRIRGDYMEVKQKKRLRVLLSLIAVLCLTSAGVLGWYWYDNNVDRSGWEMQHEQYYYRDFHNHRVSGWQDIDGHRYYFDENNVMQTGFLAQGEDIYYLDTDGTLYAGWLNFHGERYYLSEEGILQTGLIRIDEELYLLGEDGRVTTGMQEVDGSTYYFTQEGPAAVGPLIYEDQEYYFSDDNTRFTGWMDREDGLCYYTPEGPMAKGLTWIDDKLYYFEDNGPCRKGWLTQGEYSYYFGQDGAAVTGPQTIDGTKHYFTPKGIHVVLVNASNPIPSYYQPEIVTLFGWNQVAKPCLEPMKQMLDACEASGNPYTFNSSYRTHENQEEILELRTKEYMAAGMEYEEAYEKTLETVAYPGTSEHEMGLAADIVGKEANAWLAEHCWEYGFILRYPPEKGDITGITYEPWHFRYVGTEVSMDMKDTGLCLEEYLGAGPAIP